MAQRRMIDKRFTRTQRFLRLPLETQALYFHLLQDADDDGVVEAFPIIRMIGASEDSLGLLEVKGFVKPLNDEMVYFILNFLEQNTIRKDRYNPSKYINLLVSTRNGLPDGNQMGTERPPKVASDKSRVDKSRVDENRKDLDVVNTNDHNGDNSSFFDNLQKYLGRGLTFPESEQARAWREEQSEQMILKAVSIAALNRTTSFAYIDKIIRNWNNQGITTLAELQAHEEKREQAKGKQPTYSKTVKPAPEWSDPNPKVEMANPDEVKEIFDKYGIGNT